jgi:hypothetical protein
MTIVSKKHSMILSAPQNDDSKFNKNKELAKFILSSANNKYRYFHAGPYIKIYNYLFKVITKKTPG